MTQLSNQETHFAATDKLLETSALSTAKGDLARLTFMEDATKAYVAQHLRPKAPKGKRKVNVGDFAEHAIDLWNDRRAAFLSAKKGVHIEARPAEPSRKSDLKFCFQAATVRPDIVSVAWQICNTFDAKDKLRTYDCIVAAAKLQYANMERKLTDSELRGAMVKGEATLNEGKAVQALAKKLKDLAEEFTPHKAVYEAALKALAPLVQLFSGDAARDKFVAAALKHGFTSEQAIVYWKDKSKAPVSKAA